MSEDIDWDIDSLRFMVRELNKKGIEVKNEVANIFWEFRYQVTPYWTGYNCNRVLEHVNEYVEEFRNDTSNLAYDIPRRMEDWINVQAENGGGVAQQSTLISAYDTGNSEVWAVPLTDEKADGAIKISMEKVNQFFVGTELPSVRGAVEAAKRHLEEYIRIFEEYESITRNNIAAQRSVQETIEFQQRFIQKTDYMLEVVTEVAKAEIAGIEQVDIDTIKMATQQGENGAPAKNPGGSVDPCTAPGGNNGNNNTDPCVSKGPGSSNSDPCASKSDWVDPCAPKGSGNSNTDPCAPKSDWVDPCAPKGSGNSNGGSGKSKSEWVDPCSTWTDPCAPHTTSYTAPKSSPKYEYNPNEDWEKMSSENRVKRAYMNAKAYDSQYGEEFRDKMVEGMPLTDSERQKVNDLIERSNTTIQPEEYQAASYSKNSSWQDLNAEQRVSKALDNPDYIKELSDSEMKSFNEAQHKLGEHVYYQGEDEPYKVNPNDLNERQKVQWAIDIRNDQTDNGMDPSGYEKKISSVLTADQMAEVDTESRYYSNVKYGQDNNNYYTFTEDDI